MFPRALCLSMFFLLFSRSVFYFLSYVSRVFAVSLCLASSLTFFPFPSIFSCRFSVLSRRLFTRSFSLFHFSIVEGKIIYIFLRCIPLVLFSQDVITCRRARYVALQSTTKTSWQLFTHFQRERYNSRVSLTLLITIYLYGKIIKIYLHTHIDDI